MFAKGRQQRVLDTLARSRELLDLEGIAKRAKLEPAQVEKALRVVTRSGQVRASVWYEINRDSAPQQAAGTRRR